MIFLSPADSDIEHWRTGIIVALCLHLAVLVMAVLGPDLIKSHSKKEEVYTVKLFGPVKQPVKKLSPPAPKPAPAPTPSPPMSRPLHAPAVNKTPRPVPEKTHKAVPKKPAVKPKPVKKTKPAPAVKKAVSLKPEKKKQTEKKSGPKLVKKTEAPSMEELLEKRIAAIKQQVREKEQEKKLQERLNALSRKLREKKKNARHSGAQAGDAMVSGTGTAETINEIIAKYGMEVSQRVWRRWNLPTQLIDQKGLEAIIEIRIADDGRIIAHEFEKPSGNMLFDQSAMRAVKDASQVPPLPPQLRPGPLVMGIRFRPEGM